MNVLRKQDSMSEINPLKKDHIIPHDKNDIAKSSILRRKWLLEKTGVELKHAEHFSFPPDIAKRNIENFIGISQIPTGIAGPLKINGEYAQGIYYVPFATTEASLVQGYERGMIAITKAGGAQVKILNDEISVSPVFICANSSDAITLMQWCQKELESIKSVAESTTRYGKLNRLVPYLVGNRLILNLCFTTGDAMGMNMINIAGDKVSQFIINQSKLLYLKSIRYYLRSNFSSDKKPSFFNLLTGYGKSVVADIVIPRKIVNRFLNTTPEDMFDFWQSSLIGSIQAGMIGINAHYANALSAIYIACGQDVAQLANASIGISGGNVNGNGDVYVFVKANCLPVGTVGGGTSLPTQKEYLEIMGCYGTNKVKKFAEIIAGVLLSGEISICAAIASGDFIKAHVAARNR
jgi:hydroxymethylglutaryl-CoA reductase (NADPH)